MNAIQIQQTIPAIAATTSQSSRPRTVLRAKIATGALNAVENITDLRAAIKALDAEFATLNESVEKKLRQRLRDFVEPVRIAGETLQINEDGMIPEIAYDVAWDGERYQVVKGLDGIVKIFEVTSA